LVDEGKFGEAIEAYWPSGRKGFCEFLGVGESTLSGWLKDGRVPRYARVAFGLARARDLLADEVKVQRQEEMDPKVVRTPDGHYQLCRFRPDEEGVEVGTVMADRIPSFADAAFLASGMPAFRLLRQARGVVTEILERTDNEEYTEKLEDLLAEIDNLTLFAFRNRTWRERKAHFNAAWLSPDADPGKLAMVLSNLVSGKDISLDYIEPDRSKVPADRTSSQEMKDQTVQGAKE
jgi:hypothetical protein